MAGHPGTIREDTRFRILQLLEENPELSQRELAEAVRISVGSVNYLLNALIERGLVKLGIFSATPDKRRYAYVLTRKGIAEKVTLTRSFLQLKMKEYAALKAEIASLQPELGPDVGILSPKVSASSED